jgi:uncharacterized protein DUF6338
VNDQFLINPETLGAVLGLVWPGLVSMHVYRLLFATARIDWGQALLQGFFFTVINYLVGFPLVLYVLRAQNIENHPFLYWLALAGIWLVGPVLMPVVWKWLIGTSFLSRYLQQPYITPWDYYFDRREDAFVLIHLKNGHLVAGYWGPGSYASGYPEQGDLYLSAVYSVDAKGRLGPPTPSTKGLLITRDEYTYIELFEPAQQQPEVGA